MLTKYKIIPEWHRIIKHKLNKIIIFLLLLL